MNNKIATQMVQAAARLRDVTEKLRFGDSVACVYNPLTYAWASHEAYLKRYATGRRQVIFLGMNPGPFGMAQTGIPFGEIEAVTRWMGIDATIATLTPPVHQHPKRPIEGFDCARTEISGKRLWGLFAQRYPDPEDFFKKHFVVNYCPLAFMAASGKNLTPDKLPAGQTNDLLTACDRHLVEVLEILKPRWVVGVGRFAQKQAQRALACTSLPIRLGYILHPSPASPQANRNWAEKAMTQLHEQGIWSTAGLR